MLHLTLPPPQSHDAFKRGLLEFTRIANLNYQERAIFFGNSFLGVHYNNDLTAQWNATNSETICAHQLNLTAPQGWNYRCEETKSILVYKGNNPAAALDQLLQGPTVIDCGMFCQLSIWFGIRSVLGNEKFNQLFGNTPFYITQLFYNGIDNPLKPYFGNPLFDFFERVTATETVSQSVSVAHITNHPLYQLKHPGGNYQGENCIEIDGQFIIFDPSLSEKTLTKTQIAKLLCDTFNAPQNERDRDKIAAYQKLDQSETHSGLGFNYSQLISLASYLADKTILKSEFDFPIEAKLRFNFEKFIVWAQRMLQKDFSQSASYRPLSDSALSVPANLTAMIPFENRHGISFSTYRQESSLHQQLYQQSLHFCQSVMRSQSCMTILTGKAGIGKTAAAVSCAKELASRGKNVVWITEVTVKGWMDKAKSMAELDESKNEIRRLLANNPDAVFLDDDNIVGYAGQMLLEEIYTWYICNPGKGLFITSNEMVSFEKCFGLKLDEKYYFVPFAGYASAAMQGIIINANLKGQSQRPALAVSVTDLNDHEKIARLMRVPQSTRSVGIVVTPDVYNTYANQLGLVEYIPGFIQNDECLLGPIRRSLRATGSRGSTYDLLTATQKNWLQQFTASGCYFFLGNRSVYEEPHQGMAVRKFESTRCSVIAIELQQWKSTFSGNVVDDESMSQLLRVVNYAHDCGGKKIIIINQTQFSHQELMEKIKIKMDDREKERTIARIEQLFYSSELLIERVSVKLQRHVSTALICRPTTGAATVVPGTPNNNVAAFFQLMARLQASQASPNDAQECRMQ